MRVGLQLQRHLLAYSTPLLLDRLPFGGSACPLASPFPPSLFPVGPPSPRPQCPLLAPTQSKQNPSSITVLPPLHLAAIR